MGDSREVVVDQEIGFCVLPRDNETEYSTGMLDYLCFRVRNCIKL